MSNLNDIVLALFLPLLMAGCSGSNPQSDRPPPNATSQEAGLAGPTWMLTAFGEATGSTSLMEETEITATFADDERRVAGSAGCNRYFGGYELRGDQLTLLQMGTTRRACRSPIMKQAQAYLSTLESVAGWMLEGDRLTLLNGDGAPLLRFVADGNEQSDGEQPVLTGAVTYRPPIALPPGAVVHVRLEDVSRADAPAVTLTEETNRTKGRQVPIPFELRYDPSRIEPRHRYVVRAEIRGPDGALRWTTDTSHPVLTRGAPSDSVEIRVVQVSPENGAAATGSLIGSNWQLVHIEPAGGETMTPPADTTFTIMYQPNGRFGGRADCNSYGGRYETKATGRIALTGVAAARAACSPDAQADTFMSIMNAVDRYEVNKGRLRLTSKQGDTLTFAAPRSREATMRPQRTGETFVFDCDDPDGANFSFTVRTGPGELAVWLPERFAKGGDSERYLVLGQVRAASGAKYEGDGVVVWNKGNEALLEVGGETVTGCTENPQASVWEDARRSGWTFRAVGQEPGWHLEIKEGERIRFVYAYGQKAAVVPAPEPATGEAQTTYHAKTEAHDLTVTLENEPCTDAMSGARFPITVKVTLDDETYQGCGRALR